MSQKKIEKVYDREKDFSNCLESIAAVLPVFLLDKPFIFQKTIFREAVRRMPGTLPGNTDPFRDRFPCRSNITEEETDAL